MTTHTDCKGNIKQYFDGYHYTLYCDKCNIEVDENDIEDWPEKGDDYEVDE